MTPEERANTLYHKLLRLSPENYADNIETLAAAIREAVDEEREACAKIAQNEHDRPLCKGDDYDHGRVVTARYITDVIRGRRTT